MNLRKFIDAEDRAVSPVIGVILMVAITVILAAVIASLTLGLGDSAQTAPTAKFDFNQKTVTYNDPNDGDSMEIKTVDISHMSGASIDQGRLAVTVNGEEAYTTDGDSEAVKLWDSDGTMVTASSSTTISLHSIATFSPDTKVTITDPAGADPSLDVGESLESGDTVRIIWTSEDGGSSSTLQEYTVQ
ncbi:type IV pilin [Halomarina oriensis]|uniref:Type IV pilin n=1 Tax=Halomarina oriensis TaxID=671145 RepID=A0A6B0GVT0_9EURY|nr:type IV pilin N-terminal domain-containing protein [Halomarina oriensis]MWG36245.1 type IV pilin [Halomarina oriensis]